MTMDTEETHHTYGDIETDTSSPAGTLPKDDNNQAESISAELESPVSKTDRYGFTGGIQYTLPGYVSSKPTTMMKRERKWLDMLSRWEFFMTKGFPKLRKRCYKGIPDAVRAEAWMRFCGAKYRMANNQQETYQMYLRQQIDSRTHTEIENDLHRSFPNHEMFIARGGKGQQELYNVMKAYAVYNRKDGFCQGQVPLACVLLMHMPPEHAFWCLVSIIDKYIPGYYSHGLDSLKDDGQILMILLKKIYPQLHKNMLKHGIDGPLFMIEWFMCIYSRDLPWLTVLRIWDMFLCDGVCVIFKVALVLLRNSVAPKNIPDDMYDLLNCLRISKMPIEFLDAEFIVSEITKLPISEKHLSKAHKKLEKWKRKRQKKLEKKRSAQVSTS